MHDWQGHAAFSWTTPVQYRLHRTHAYYPSPQALRRWVDAPPPHVALFDPAAARRRGFQLGPPAQADYYALLQVRLCVV